MPDLTLTVPVYLDLDPGCAVLVKSSSAKQPAGRLHVVSGDERLFSFRLHQTPEGSTWQRVALPTGWTMVLSGKLAAGGETAYFANSTWATAGSGSTLAYTATLDFAVTDETWGSPAQPSRVFFMDLEIRDTTNTVRGTWQFELELHRENYGSGDTPDDPDAPFLDRPSADNIYLSFDAAQTLTSGQKTQGQTNLGGSTVGRAVFSLTNPSAVTWLRVNADNTVTARTAAETRSDIGAGTGSGDLLNSGTITTANSGKVAVITADNTLGAGVSYTSAATASTIVSRDAAGQFKGGNTDIEARVGPSASGPNASYAFGVFDALDSILMGGFRFVGFTANDLESVAYKSISAQFKAWNTDGGTIKTADGTTVMTFGVSNSTAVTFAGAVTVNGPATFNEDADFNGELRINAHALAIGNPVTFAGAYPLTATLTGTTAVTFPASGTLATLAGTETLSGKTLTLPTITGFVESVVAIGNTGTSKTIALTSGTVQTATLTGNCTFTMPTATAGTSFTLLLNTGAGSYTATFTGVKWSGSSAPVVTTTASRLDIFTFVADGTNWYGSSLQNFTP